MNKTLFFEKYAQLVLKVGVNLQPGEILYADMPTEYRELGIIMTRRAFEMGARDVVINWVDEEFNHLRMKYASEEVLSEVPEFKKAETRYWADRHACKVIPCIFYPELNNDIPIEKLNAFNCANRVLRNIEHEYTDRGERKWNAFVIGNPAWADKIYPDLPEEERYDRFFEEIAKIVRITEDTDPVENWIQHCEDLAKYSKWLNEQNFSSIHITTGLGTDVTVGLVKDHIWNSAGAMSGDPKNSYCANMPTEEIFTAPDKFRVNGKVVASRPLFINGRMVEDFYVEFKDGAVCNMYARKELEALQGVLDVHPNSKYIGEIALVPNSSPISQTNLCYYFVPLDENAASHMALGTSFTSCIKGGTAMSKEELELHGVNIATNHVDFMYGTADMYVTGLKYDGTEVVVMENGEFVI